MATRILLSDPDLTQAEIEAVTEALHAPRLSDGPIAAAFEAAFAASLGRKHGVALSSGTIALLLVLKAHGIGAGDEVIASSFSWRETAHAILLAGAVPVFADIDYWSGALAADKAEARITERTRAILAANTNGHPAPWAPLRALAETHGLLLIEDSTEAIGSRYRGALVGSFGDCAVFDFSQPAALACGEGAMVVVDDDEIAARLRHLRGRRPEERGSVVIGATVPYQARMSELAAALGLVQLKRLELLLARRKRVEQWYHRQIQSFEGIKDPYTAPEVDEVHWFLYVVHLGTRFSRSSRDAIIDDLHTAEVEAAAYCHPLHLQPRYVALGHRRGDLFVTEKLADRAVALPFQAHLSEDQVAHTVGTMKDASINVGAGTAIYL